MIDYDAIAAAGGIAKGPSRQERKQAKQTAAAENWREVCRVVDSRDQGKCRVCKTPCSPTAIEMLKRAERHHIVSLAQGGTDASDNLVTLCWKCHQGKGGRHGLSAAMRLTGNADERDERGRLNGLVVERLTDAGWTVDKTC